MQENKYDNSEFFKQYSLMSRSVKGLDGAGEWHVLQSLFPDFDNKKVLDLGCGFGWHAKYAVNQGAKSVVAVDLSENMLKKAREINSSPKIDYHLCAIEDFDFKPNRYDVVISSLSFHYLASFDEICFQINKSLVQGGRFVFSIEHPIFTAQGRQDWTYDESGNVLHWPLDHYFSEGKREANFLGTDVVKYHRTLTSYISSLIKNGFELNALVEPMPSELSLSEIPEMKDEMRRPMFLIISAVKK
ncbi:SAM-dependent methyltransferase [Sphingobacteriaceae bacterium GW460-11-11-14-LB5]|nr:SAM-dependent methyltransferase [Sphingobacteriaceae bacterium GW460-11-11-14-LB5]